MLCKWAIESVAWMYHEGVFEHKYREIPIDKVYQWIINVVQGNDKMYWRAFSLLNHLLTSLLLAEQILKDFNKCCYMQTHYMLCVM
jgi:hypothetical protein